jgi:SAM-dependent methyltransferase
MKEFIDSTLTKNSKARLIETIPVNQLIKGYKKELKIDVSRFFKDIPEIGIYECEKTKYRFYYPFNIEGDSSFYQELQQYDWYYMPWKWEHETIKNILSINEKILEVGSGGLGFVERMQQSGFNITGLELNRDSIVKGEKLNLNVLNETIQEHSTKHFEEYNVVCSFQVLEHISDVESFLKAQIDCLKKGGKLIISVPNNSSFIKLTSGLYLNKPPHHMGLWDKKSLISLTKLFDLKIEKVMFEPLAKYHLDWYISLTTQNKIYKVKLFKVAFKKLKIKNIYTSLIKKFRTKIKGHSMLVVYNKI